MNDLNVLDTSPIASAIIKKEVFWTRVIGE